MSIAISLIHLAADEGQVNAKRTCEGLIGALVDLVEIGSPDEVKAATFLIGSVQQALKEINQVELVQIAANEWWEIV